MIRMSLLLSSRLAYLAKLSPAGIVGEDAFPIRMPLVFFESPQHVRALSFSDARLRASHGRSLTTKALVASCEWAWGILKRLMDKLEQHPATDCLLRGCSAL